MEGRVELSRVRDPIFTGVAEFDSDLDAELRKVIRAGVVRQRELECILRVTNDRNKIKTSNC